MNNVIGSVAITPLKQRHTNACSTRLSIVIISNAMFLKSDKTATFITIEMTANTVAWNNFFWFRLIVIGFSSAANIVINFILANLTKLTPHLIPF